MDDTSSTASFEDIGPSSDTAQLFKDAIANRAVDDAISPELAKDEVPDVCYVLQYRDYHKVVEVRRSDKPINIEFGRIKDTEVPTTNKKSILEIITVVSMSVVEQQPIGLEDDDFHQVRHFKTENTVLIIYSSHLINALKAVVSYYPGTSFVGTEVKVEAPYCVLVHHRAALARYKFNQPDTHDQEYASTTAKHIDILLEFLETACGEQIREEEKRHSYSTPTATFDYLWLLLRPGEVIYTHHDHTWTPFVISHVINNNFSVHNRRRVCMIGCWNYVYSDGLLRRTMYSFEIPFFSGEWAINQLRVIPARFYTGLDGSKSPSEITAEHVRLGKIVWDLCKAPSYKSYDGDLINKTQLGDRNNKTATGYMTGRVIIDCEGYERYFSPRSRDDHRHQRVESPPLAPPKDLLPHFAPRCGCVACNKEERTTDLSPYVAFQNLNPKCDSAPESDLYFHVLSKVVGGFVPGERRWGRFHVDGLEDIKFDKEAFKYLVLDEDIKLTLKALIGKFSSKDGHVSAWPNDFVKNKGQGRVFLLHGSPGVGKTCTAECVAELTHRPLLSLTSGDLRTSPFKVESSLQCYLELGERYGAVVLLDEADVYLESRRAQDIERNGLVSVFLRALEYYRGLLFLTTNRVQTFDAAFTSRIHVALHYGPLTDAHRERIWTHGFERLERDAGGRVRVAVAAREYAWGSADVRSLRWNGREIRNALQTAVALAESEALEDGIDVDNDDGAVVMVLEKHLRSVVRMSRGFKTFLRRRRRLRDDDSVLDDGDDDDEGVEEDEEADYSDHIVDDGPRILYN
ncbi:hypothetical protein F5Y19DRAFT_468299 [Xylariaceae sp. FL1651]|nr:hypothetical protein F5Y19DRAFT_468299 [Xylariaceae sp. FL1651]